jgi:hypothetical protein
MASVQVTGHPSKGNEVGEWKTEAPQPVDVGSFVTDEGTIGYVYSLRLVSPYFFVLIQ